MRRKKTSSLVEKIRSRKNSRRWKKSAAAGSARLSLESLEARNLLAVTTFVQGVGGYTSGEDTGIFSRSPDVNFGTEAFHGIDQQDINGVRQGLVKFGNIFGNGPGQIPLGSTINSATLSLSVEDPSNTSAQISLYRMLVTWNESTATWNNFGAIGGVQASEGEASGFPPDATLIDASLGRKNFNVKTSLQHWAAGENNFGWMVESAATNGWDMETSEAAEVDRPTLTVDFTPPPVAAGVAQFIDTVPRITEGNSDHAYMLDVARSGGVTGELIVNYAITAGTAEDGSDLVVANGTVMFANGVAKASIAVQIEGDDDLEGFEQFTVTLTGAVGANAVATATIADDDALINEVLANITNTTVLETDREYIELIGTPGESLNGYYFVVFEGEANADENPAAYGTADMVINLAGQSFGANGLLVITSTNWAYESLRDPMTNRFPTTRLDGDGGRLEDSSQTYALFRSPTNPLVEGTDYDTVGAFENATELAIGTGVGILDQLPAGAQMVDSVGVVEGGGGDRDRVLTTQDLNHPGVHVHIPTGLLNSEGVTSDAVSRRFIPNSDEDTQPNTVGVWFNGDIPNGTVTPIQYAPDPSRSVVAPGGAVITPGSHNILRNVLFTVTKATVQEAAGMVTLTVTRTGDTSSAIDVGYSTSNETAVAGEDYAAVTNGMLHFDVGDDSEDITISLLADDDAEGFESFRVNLTSATSPFLITAGTAIVTIQDANVNVRTFQNAPGGYGGTRDAYLDSRSPIDPAGFNASIVVSQEIETAAVATNSRPSQGLLRFDDIFGAAGTQVPLGSKIFGAFVTVNVVDPSAADAQIRFFRMLNAWSEGSATWADPQGASGSSISNGVTPDGVEADSIVDALVGSPGAAGLVDVALNVDTIQAWANGTLENLGWAIVNNSADDWAFGSSNDFLSVNPFFPKLTILYTDPVPADVGEFSLSNDAFIVNENGTASVTVNRVGGSMGAATVNYQVTAGSGSLADITGSGMGSISFAAGELFETITIPINDDSSLESNETLTVTISGTGLDFDRDTATLTIRDNDFSSFSPTLLLNEFFINSPGNDGTHEFIELAGMPSSGLGSLYYVAVDGDVGPTEGSAEFVVDLGGTGAGLNGSNGHTLIAAENGFDFTVPAGTNFIGRSDLNAEGLRNGTNTFMLIFSPDRTLTSGDFDYDWDNNGTLDLPAGAQIIDLMAIKDSSATDIVYPASGTFAFTSETDHPSYHADALSRFRGNTARVSASAWFHGDLTEAGDDPLVYNQIASFNTGLPVPGAAVTPGEQNTGTALQSPLVALTSVTPNLPAGTVTVSFTGSVTQSLKGTGSGDRGVSITDTSGNPVAGVDIAAVVAGLGTNTLTLSFTGPNVVNGFLPAGEYRLSFLGNGLIGNGRAVDAANNGTLTGSNFTFVFTQPTAPDLDGDYDGNNQVNGHDFMAWQRQLGGPGTADGNNSGTVDGPDLGIWEENYGEPAGAPALAAVTIDPSLVDLAMAVSGFQGGSRTALRPAYRPPTFSTPQSAAASRAGLAATFAVASDAGSDDEEDQQVDALFAELGAGVGGALARAL